jgi:hypothetical protein
MVSEMYTYICIYHLDLKANRQRFYTNVIVEESIPVSYYSDGPIKQIRVV